MTEFGLETSGINQQIRELRERRNDWTGGDDTWYVGTAVEYAVYLEYGTSKMDPKPFFRPAIEEARRDLEAFVEDNTETSFEAIDGITQLVATIAFALERRVKEIITEKGLIDTGVMRASVLAVPTDPSVLPEAEDFDIPDKGAVDPQEGRRLVQQDLEVAA